MLSANIKQRINSTYAEYNDGTVELEARFGKKTFRGFKPGVSIQVFNRIKSYFDKNAEGLSSKTTDYIGNNIRKTVTSPEGSDNPQIIWIQKTRLWNQDDKNYNIRYSTSREIPIHPVENFEPEIIREKNRYSYQVFKNTVRIDLTMVDMLDLQNKKRGETRYEVEIELINPRGLKSFESAIRVVLQKILDTITLYTSKEADTIISHVNMVLGGRRRNIIDNYPLVQARNLKLKDMVWGGLIGNKNTGYSVTHKADGKRKMLVFHSSGVWLVMAPDSINRVTSTQIPTLNGAILDGEMIPLDHRSKGAPKSRIWYMAFDCLSWNNDKSIQDKPHGMRMNHAQAVADILKTNVIHVNTKSFRNFGTPQEFYMIMRDMFRSQEHLTYKQDGFMFTPVNAVYNPHSDNNKLRKRVLTKYPDICKWKPKHQLTIDFKIQWKASMGGRVVNLYSNVKGKPVLFVGSDNFPYNGEIDNNNILTNEIPNGTIVEYGWDYERNLLIPHIIRHDKFKPNSLSVAIDVWEDINRPLERTTMIGDTFVLMRRYHNRIKRDLFGYDNNLTLLDIGSGRGGDVAKWRRYSKIVAVEPNAEHIVELRRRLELHNMTDRVRIVNTGGEDIETIYRNVREFIGDRVDVVSMMLSMSFFWRNQSMVNRLINTIGVNIKENGRMIFLTIDGDLVEQTFEPAFDTGPALTRLDLGPATLTYNSTKIPKELHINIEGTIVQDQTEWLVRLQDLIEGMRNFGFDFTERKRADEERFLTEEEITMTQMYTYGVISATEKISLPEMNQVLPNKEVFPGLLTDQNEINLVINNTYVSPKKLETIEKPPINDTQVIFGKHPITPTKSSETFETLKTIKNANKKMESDKSISFPGFIPLQDIQGFPITGLELPGVVHDLPKLPTVTTVTTGTEQTGNQVFPVFPGAVHGLPGLPKLPIVTTGTEQTGFPPQVFPDLPVLPVLPNIAIPEILNFEHELPGIPTDTYETLRVSWYQQEPVVRIGAIGDGSCFFHATLGGYYPPYQNNADSFYRMDLVKKIRRDIAYTLQMDDPNNEHMTLWETAANGQFAALYEQQLMGLDFGDIFDFPVDFSLEGLQRLFNSLQYLGNEVYQYASDMLGIDIYIMRLTNQDLYVHQNTSVRGKNRKIVMISGNGNHYETVGVERENMFQTVFDQNDPFIVSMRALIEDEGGI